jgi:hypothetical protein
MLRKLKADQYNVTIVSPRNYFLFTPLLPSTTTGLINIQAIIEPIRDYCRRANASHAKYAVWRPDGWLCAVQGFAGGTDPATKCACIYFPLRIYEAECSEINPDNNTIKCKRVDPRSGASEV